MLCGAGGIRTLVQTDDNTAFYMLIFLLIVGYNPERSAQVVPYLLNIRFGTGALPKLS
jgi:hypothetical protein